MLRKIGRLFVIKTRFEASLIIYALGLGAVERGKIYLEVFPGIGGWLLMAACTGSVFLAAWPRSLTASPTKSGSGNGRKRYSNARPAPGRASAGSLRRSVPACPS